MEGDSIAFTIAHDAELVMEVAIKIGGRDGDPEIEQTVSDHPGERGERIGGQILFEIGNGTVERVLELWIVARVRAMRQRHAVVTIEHGTGDDPRPAAVRRKAGETRCGQSQPVRGEEADAAVIDDRLLERGHVETVQQFAGRGSQMRIGGKLA